MCASGRRDGRRFARCRRRPSPIRRSTGAASSPTSTARSRSSPIPAGARAAARAGVERARGACCRRDRRRGDARHPRRAASGASADSVSPASGEHPRPHQAGQRRRPGSRARGQGPHRGPGQLRSGGTRRGQGHGPARDALRAPAGRGDQGEPRLAAPRRPRLRARHDRDPDPRAHPGQAGGRRRGAQHLGEPGDARRHLPGAHPRGQARSRRGSARTSRAPAWPATWPGCRTS